MAFCSTCFFDVVPADLRRLISRIVAGRSNPTKTDITVIQEMNTPKCGSMNLSSNIIRIAVKEITAAPKKGIQVNLSINLAIRPPVVMSKGMLINNPIISSM